jgi:hypothetical protein
MLGQQQGAVGAQGQLYNQTGAMGSQLAGVGGQQMQLGGQQQQQQLERLRGMQSAGENQRRMQNQSLAMGYQDWQNQQDQERANIGWQQAAMSGLPYQGSVTQSRYTPQPSNASSLMSAGIAGMGAWNSYNQGQQGKQGKQGQDRYNNSYNQDPNVFAGSNMGMQNQTNGNSEPGSIWSQNDALTTSGKWDRDNQSNSPWG